MRILALLILVAGCQGNGGAVSARWRLRDLTTGEQFNPRDVGMSGGVCEHQDPFWHIDRVRIVVADPVTRAELSLSANDVEFDCSKREGTTPFKLPLGTFALSLRARPEGMASSPAGQIRTISKGEIVNLDIIELGVNPLPPGGDGGSPVDGGSPD